MASVILGRATRAQFSTLLDASAMRRDDTQQTAIIYLETGQSPLTITRAEFRQSVIQAAHFLRQHGLQPRDTIIIAHEQSLTGMFLFWGALQIGVIPSMMPPLTEKLDRDIYSNQIQTLVSHNDAKLIFTSTEFAAVLAQWVDCPVFGEVDLAAMLPDGTDLYPSPPDEIAFLQHSSGTTGLQKGVALSHQAVLNQLASYSDTLQLTNKDVIISWLPLYHDMGLIAGFLLPLVQGIPLILMSPFDWVKHPAMLLHAINDYGGTLCWLPNFAYNHMARRIRQRDVEGISLRTMRAFINCSEPVYHHSHLLFLERFGAFGLTSGQLGVSYAMAENTFAVTQTPLGQYPQMDVVDRAALEGQQMAAPCIEDLPTAQVNVSCGPAIPDTAVIVLDDAGHPLPDRHVGELAVQSSYMLTEYFKRPDLNASLWHNGWYRTGDMGYLVNGEVFVVGRQKDLIINAGKNVYPQDLEAIVNTIEGVHPGRVVAFGVYDERDGTELIGIVAEATTTDPTERHRIVQQIRQRIAQQTTVTATYVQVVDREWLIKTSSGKIARAANRDKWKTQFQ